MIFLAPSRRSWEGERNFIWFIMSHLFIIYHHTHINPQPPHCPILSLYKLEYLYLDDNEFEDNVPNELGELTNLKKLSLHNNDLVGSVGDRICKLADELFLTQLSADCGGEIPEVFCDCCLCHDHEPIVHLNADEP